PSPSSGVPDAGGAPELPGAAEPPGAAVPDAPARGAPEEDGDAVASTLAARSAGTLGPILTPATRGQAIPRMNPARPTIPTRDQIGWSVPARGISTFSGRSALAIAGPRYHRCADGRK